MSLLIALVLIYLFWLLLLVGFCLLLFLGDLKNYNDEIQKEKTKKKFKNQQLRRLEEFEKTRKKKRKIKV